MLYENGTNRLETYSRSLGDSRTDTWKFLKTKPKNCNVKLFEAGYYFLVNSFGKSVIDTALTTHPDTGFLSVLAFPDNQVASDAHLYVKASTEVSYVPDCIVNFCNLIELAQSISLTDSTVVVKGGGSVRVNSFVYIDNEILYITSASENVLNVKRGVFDTIPAQHSSGTMGYVFRVPNVSRQKYVASDVVDAKLVVNVDGNLLSVDATNVNSLEFNARAIRPYPPANVKINGEYWPVEIETDLTITWVDRNRIQQTGGEILGWFEAGVTIESNTTTQLSLTQFDESQVELETVSVNVSSASTYTYPMSALEIDARTIRIELKTVRDGFECAESFVHTVEISQFFSAPYDLTVEFKND